MKLSSLLSLIFPVIVLLACYIFIQLNPNVIGIDLLFINVEATIGMVVIIAFMSGIFIALILELLNYLKKRKSLKNE